MLLSPYGYVKIMVEVAAGALIKDVIRKMRFAQTKDEVINLLLMGLNKALQVDGSAFFILDSKRKHLKGHLGQPPEKWPNLEKVIVSLDMPAYCVDVVKTGQPQVVYEAEKDPKMVAWLVHYYGCKSVLLWPLIVEQQTLGCIVISESQKVRHFSETEIQAVNYLTATAGKIITKLQEKS